MEIDRYAYAIGMDMGETIGMGMGMCEVMGMGMSIGTRTYR